MEKWKLGKKNSENLEMKAVNSDLLNLQKYFLEL